MHVYPSLCLSVYYMDTPPPLEQHATTLDVSH